MRRKTRYTKTQAFEDYKGRDFEECLTFAEKITHARVNYGKGKKGLSLTSAAKKIGISTVYLTQLERGLRVSPNAGIVYNIEKIYGFETGELAKLLLEEQKDPRKERVALCRG